MPPSTPGDVEESRVAHGIPLPTALLGERREVVRISVMNALAGNLGARPKGRPQYIPQWALPEGMPAYPPPPVDRALPAWAVASDTMKPRAFFSLEHLHFCP